MLFSERHKEHVIIIMSRLEVNFLIMQKSTKCGDDQLLASMTIST